MSVHSAPVATAIGRAEIKTASALTTGIDLADEPLYKNTFNFTREEENALEDVKLELQRKLDMKVTKNYVIRAGLHLLIEDYVANGERSHLVQKLRRRS